MSVVECERCGKVRVDGVWARRYDVQPVRLSICDPCFKERLWREVTGIEVEERRTILSAAAQADTHSSDVEPMVERLESKW